MLAIGLMSGTSLDGVDSSLIETDGENYFKELFNFHIPYPLEFQTKLRKLIDTKQDWFELEQELTNYHAICVLELLNKAKVNSNEITVSGFPGQTIYHNPTRGITWQIGNPHLLAKLTNIDVVSDFRRRDVVYGGQGAPLVPIFHKCLMKDEQMPVAILNIGGVANITYIDNSNLIAFDTGPGNALINDAILKHYNKTYDDQGIIASSGKVNSKLIEQILADDFFKKLPPKSLDRNHFIKHNELLTINNPQDLVATLTKLTASSISIAIRLLPKIPSKIYLCGGGCKNITLLEWLREENKHIGVEFTDITSLGLDPDFIEAQAFAYLAIRFLKMLPSSFPSTTSVSQETLSGVLFPSS